MALKAINPVQTSSWQQLLDHANDIKSVHLKNLFSEDSDRAAKLSIRWQDFFVDYSKNRIDDTTRDLLLKLANEMNLKSGIEKYFSGDIINVTEGRAVLHTALRGDISDEVMVDGENVMPDVYDVRSKVRSFVNGVISGDRKGYLGKTFTDIVNIGIGGSDLGPAMVVESLQYYRNHLKVHFVSNVDGDHVQETLKNIDPETTLFVIVSKSFTTQETISNAQTIKQWFVDRVSTDAVSDHFVAVSTNLLKTEAFGIDSNNVFPMWDWVGGRFSLWSAVGLSIALSVGNDHYESLLSGAHEMDVHFRETPFSENIPVILALLTIWYNNMLGAESEAIIPYTQYLNRFSAYLQQGIMESNGKSIDRYGQPIEYQTGTIIWGEPGTNSQHAFFQLMHQGTKLIPADFIGFKSPLHGDMSHHDKLMSNFFAQTEALMNGKSSVVVREELAAKGMNKGEAAALLPYKVFEGNKPTNTILINRLTPDSLGKLIAMYEHKIFVQGYIWNIYSYDQWGVELGKQLASTILKELTGEDRANHDGSTSQLLQEYRK